MDNKADKDLSNVSNVASSFKEASVGWGMPSSKYINLTLGASGAQYTAPANGIYCYEAATTGNSYMVMVGETTLLSKQGSSVLNPQGSLRCDIEVKKGDKVRIIYGIQGKSSERFIFIYCEGEN